MKDIFARLESADLARLKHSAREAQRLETKWDMRVKQYMNWWVAQYVESKAKGTPVVEFDLQKLFEEQYFDVAFESFKIASGEDEIEKRYQRLAKPLAPKFPKSLGELRKLYDLWRKGKYSPKRPKKIAQRIQKEYLKRIQSAWDRASQDFQQGKTFNQKEVVKEIQDAAKVSVARAQMTVRTETTNGYNTVRKEYYDQSQDVTHYLFMAVRDKATTPWCSPKTTDGKRGRHGLVYSKGDPLLKKEKPACHWNCRSEILPLSPKIPSHLRLIKDASIQRRNVECHPLPPGWGA